MTTAKRHRADVRGLQDEANRTAEKYKNEVNPELSDKNLYFVRSDDWNGRINEVLEEAEIVEHKKSVVLLTSVYSASPEFFVGKTRDEILDYFRTCLEWERHRGTVISAVVHLDETTPHMQVATIPVVDVPNMVCEPVWQKDENGQELLDAAGERIPEVYKTGKSSGKVKYRRYADTDDTGRIRTHKGLNAAYVIGNKVKMSQSQTDFWKCCGKPYGLTRGKIRIVDGSEAIKRKDEATYRADRIVASAEDVAGKMLDKACKTANERVRGADERAARSRSDADAYAAGLRQNVIEYAQGIVDGLERREQAVKQQEAAAELTRRKYRRLLEQEAEAVKSAQKSLQEASALLDRIQAYSLTIEQRNAVERLRKSVFDRGKQAEERLGRIAIAIQDEDRSLGS